MLRKIKVTLLTAFLVAQDLWYWARGYESYFGYRAWEK